MGNQREAIVYDPATTSLDSVYIDPVDGQATERVQADLVTQGGSTGSWADALIRTWHGTAIAFALLAGVVFAIYQWGVPLGADLAAKAMPSAWADKIESAVLKDLDGTFCTSSALGEDRQAQLQRGFQSMLAATSSSVRPVGTAILLFRSCPVVGPNAFNLGRKTIVLTDAMVGFASDPARPKDDAAVMGVLAHELGHLQNDHVMRGILRSAGVGLMATALLGDVSGLLAAAPAVVLRNQYTRGFETEADIEALARLQASRIPSKPLAAMFKKLSEKEPSSKKMEWLFSHPGSAERAKLFDRD